MNAEMMRLTAARLTFGMASTGELSRAAARLLATGRETPSLLALASLGNDDDMDDARRLFLRTMSEIDLPMPSNREAVDLLAREIAGEIVKGAVLPKTGAVRIWQLTLDASENIHELDAFIYAASEWEDRPEDRPFFERAILVAARELLQIQDA